MTENEVQDMRIIEPSGRRHLLGECKDCTYEVGDTIDIEWDDEQLTVEVTDTSGTLYALKVVNRTYLPGREPSFAERMKCRARKLID